MFLSWFLPLTFSPSTINSRLALGCELGGPGPICGPVMLSWVGQSTNIGPGFVLSCTANNPASGPDLCREFPSLKPVLVLV